MFNVFGNSPLGRGGGIVPQYPQISRDDRRKAERVVKKVCEPLGNVMEKYNNINDSVENATESISPIKIIEHKISSKSVEDAKAFFPKGAHIAVDRCGYSHHGIYDGSGYVYEYNDFVVRCVSLSAFAEGSKVYEFSEEAVYSPNEIVRRALSRVGESEYNLLYNNCQNFATWCRCG